MYHKFLVILITKLTESIDQHDTRVQPKNNQKNFSAAKKLTRNLQ